MSRLVVLGVGMLNCLLLISAGQAEQKVVDSESNSAAEWPQSSEQLLKLLRERDKDFEKRSIEVEQRWTERISPKAQIANRSFIAIKFGNLVPKLPPKEDVPKDYDQSHRVHYKLIVQGAEVTLGIIGEQEKILHPEYNWSLNDGHLWSTVGGEERSYSPQTKSLHLFGPPKFAGQLRGFQRRFEWGCGYGVAKWIQSIDAMELKDGRLNIKGSSQLFEGDDSQFEMVLNQDLIVRSILVKVPSKPNGFDVYFVGTVGTQRGENHLPIAKRGHYQRILQPEGKPESVYEEFDIVFIKASAPLSDEEYKKQTEINPPPGTTTIEMRKRR